MTQTPTSMRQKNRVDQRQQGQENTRKTTKKSKAARRQRIKLQEGPESHCPNGPDSSTPCEHSAEQGHAQRKPLLETKVVGSQPSRAGELRDEPSIPSQWWCRRAHDQSRTRPRVGRPLVLQRARKREVHTLPPSCSASTLHNPPPRQPRQGLQLPHRGPSVGSHRALKSRETVKTAHPLFQCKIRGLPWRRCLLKSCMCYEPFQ